MNGKLLSLIEQFMAKDALTARVAKYHPQTTFFTVTLMSPNFGLLRTPLVPIEFWHGLVKLIYGNALMAISGMIVHTTWLKRNFTVPNAGTPIAVTGCANQRLSLILLPNIPILLENGTNETNNHLHTTCRRAMIRFGGVVRRDMSGTQTLIAVPEAMDALIAQVNCPQQHIILDITFLTLQPSGMKKTTDRPKNSLRFQIRKFGGSVNVAMNGQLKL